MPGDHALDVVWAGDQVSPFGGFTKGELLPPYEQEPWQAPPEGVPPSDPVHAPRKGPATRLRVLTEEQVTVIRDKYLAGGISGAGLARLFHVTRATIRAIVRQQTWRHLLPPNEG